MTLAYDTELLRVALERTIAAAGDVHAHNPPEWMRHRLTHIIGECLSMCDALKAYEIETEGCAS
jgi:hypothetical protein